VLPFNLSEAESGQAAVHKFRIPQFGTLNRAYLKIRMENQWGSEVWSQAKPAEGRRPWLHQVEQQNGVSDGKFWSHGATAQHALEGILGTGTANNLSNRVEDMPLMRHGGASSCSWNVVKAIDHITLQTHNKIIESIPGETIPTEVERMQPQLRDFYRAGMLGYSAGNRTTGAPERSYENLSTPYDPSRCGKVEGGGMHSTTGYRANNHADFIVPVTLSSMKHLTKNYQTRFVEDLELHIKTKDFGSGAPTEGPSLAGTSKYVIELVLLYHNWHDNIENSLRNSNYKRGIPASIFSTNWYTEVPSVPYGVDGHRVSLSCRNLASEILIVGKRVSRTFQYGDAQGVAPGILNEYAAVDARRVPWTVTFTGSGKTIWEGTNLDLQGPDTADYDLVDRRSTAGGINHVGVNQVSLVGYPEGAHADQYDLKADGGLTHAGLKLSHDTQSGVSYGFGDNMFSLRFGFQTTDEFYSGGIALQTISNPQLTMTRYCNSAGDAKQPLNADWKFQVYVKYSNLVRIDSDTGAITRTLDV